MLIAAALGVVVPLAFLEFSRQVDSAAAALTIQLASLVLVPVLVSRVAFRQGFNLGRASASRDRTAA
jgi:hypothetical protein